LDRGFDRLGASAELADFFVQGAEGEGERAGAEAGEAAL